jgi:hypothetical protein
VPSLQTSHPVETLNAVRGFLRIAVLLGLPVAAVIVGLALATSGTAATSTTTAVDALVVGKLIACHPGHGGLHCFVWEHATVSAYSSEHRLVARETVTNGHFAFLVRPGRFTLVTKSPPGRRSVTAKAHTTVHTNIDIALH